MWIYEQATGALAHDDTLVAMAFSGEGEGKNNPDMQHVANVGPIPRGAYLIGAQTDNPKFHQPALHLVPLTGTEVYGRSGFLLHGGTESHGCILADPVARQRVVDSHDRLLVVLSGKRRA